MFATRVFSAHFLSARFSPLEFLSSRASIYSPYFHALLLITRFSITRFSPFLLPPRLHPISPRSCIFSLVSQIFSSCIKFFSLHRFFLCSRSPVSPRRILFRRAFSRRFCLHYHRIFIIKKISGVPSSPRRAPLSAHPFVTLFHTRAFSRRTDFFPLHNSTLCISTSLIFRPV